MCGEQVAAQQRPLSFMNSFVWFVPCSGMPLAICWPYYLVAIPLQLFGQRPQETLHRVKQGSRYTWLLLEHFRWVIPITCTVSSASTAAEAN